jgi:ferredoxin-nitrite reductase
MPQDTPTLKEPPSLELVLKRNSVERLKREKSPLGMVEELPALIGMGYADVPEEDIVRLKWWGLYHDKPKVGTFMLRIKLAAGRLTPAQVRAIGELSVTHGKSEAELTTRQNVQLHNIRLDALPTVMAALEDAGLTSLGGCGDAVRAITGCPAAGIAHDELFDVTDVLQEAHDFFTGHPEYNDLPRKHKISIGACTDRCWAPEINCISLVGVHGPGGEEGFAVLVGGGLSSVPRIARDVGVFVTKGQAIPVLRALLDAWKEDLRYRLSRVKSRMKFMVDDYGPEGMRTELERRLGYTLPDYRLEPLDREPTEHLGVQPQKQDGLTTIGVPVHVGLISGEQLLRLADLADALRGEIRITRQQNFLLADIPEAAVADAVRELEEIGFPLALGVRGGSIACTGEPHCNYSVTETKTRLDGLIGHLEGRFGEDVAPLRLHLDGCPHACAQHWVGDLGFQGTSVRDDAGVRRQAYDVYLRGALGPRAAIARPVFRRVPSEDLNDLVEGLIAGWLDRRIDDQGFREFCDDTSDDELGVLAGREPARSRGKEET